MKLAPLALAVAALSAHAQTTTYIFNLDGTQQHFLNAYECPGQVCTVPYIVSAWNATLVVTAPEGDGTFADGVTYSLDGLQLIPYVFNPTQSSPTLRLTVAGDPEFTFTGTAVDGP